MFVIKKDGKRLNEANETALTPVCTVDVQKIFALLHAKAVAAADAKGVLIENTAADGNDTKTAVFHSAGEHMIVARPKVDVKKISKKEALDGIKEYIGVFCGEDVKDALKDDECFPLPKGGAGSGSSDVSESAVPSFSMFLSKSAGMKFIMEADEADDDDDEDEAQSGEDLDGAESEEDADEMEDDEDADEAGETDPGDEAGETDPGDEGEDDDPEDEEIEPGKEKPDAERDGWYVLYGLKIKGLKETTVQDALKQWGSNFLKGFGVKLIDGWGASGGELHTVGKLVKGLKGLFGAIDDPNFLADRVQKELKKKYPSLMDINVEFRDKKTLTGDLDVTKREGYDGKVKQKILGADYSMYINVMESDPRQPLLNRKIIANVVTMQIKGLFKKFKNMIKADDVIYLRGAELAKANPEAIRKLEEKIPTYDEVEKKVKDEKTYQAVWVALEKMFDEKILKDKTYMSSQKCKNVVQTWIDFKKKYNNASETLVKDPKLRPVDPDAPTKDERLKAFGSFLKKYEDAVSDEDDELTVDENMFVAYDMLTEMFGNNRWNDSAVGVFEDDQPSQVLNELSAETVEYPENNGNKEQADENGNNTDNVSTGKEDDTEEADSNDEETSEKHGDDLYLIPMPGITFDKSDDKDDMKGADVGND